MICYHYCEERIPKVRIVFDGACLMLVNEITETNVIIHIQTGNLKNSNYQFYLQKSKQVVRNAIIAVIYVFVLNLLLS